MSSYTCKRCHKSYSRKDKLKIHLKSKSADCPATYSDITRDDLYNEVNNRNYGKQIKYEMETNNFTYTKCSEAFRKHILRTEMSSVADINNAQEVISNSFPYLVESYPPIVKERINQKSSRISDVIDFILKPVFELNVDMLQRYNPDDTSYKDLMECWEPPELMAARSKILLKSNITNEMYYFKYPSKIISKMFRMVRAILMGYNLLEHKINNNSYSCWKIYDADGHDLDDTEKEINLAIHRLLKHYYK